MWETYSFSPTVSVLFAGIFQTLLLISYVLAPQNFKTKNRKLQGSHTFFMHLFFCLYFLFGIIFFDAAILWLMGQWMYSDWRFQLPAVILILIIGIQYIVGSMFINPKLGNLIFAICSIVVVLLMIHVIIPLMTLWEGTYLILRIFFFLLIFYIILNYYMYKKNPEKITRELWDWTKKFQKIFSRKFNIILFCILMVEVWLKLFGTSLFIW